MTKERPSESALYWATIERFAEDHAPNPMELAAVYAEVRGLAHRFNKPVEQVARDILNRSFETEVVPSVVKAAMSGFVAEWANLVETQGPYRPPFIPRKK
jgi:hypothetical protein